MGERRPREKELATHLRFFFFQSTGTPFMARLSTQLQYFVNKKIAEDAEWRGVEIILSGHDVSFAQLSLLRVSLDAYEGLRLTRFYSRCNIGPWRGRAQDPGVHSIEQGSTSLVRPLRLSFVSLGLLLLPWTARLTYVDVYSSLMIS